MDVLYSFKTVHQKELQILDDCWTVKKEKGSLEKHYFEWEDKNTRF